MDVAGPSCWAFRLIYKRMMPSVHLLCSSNINYIIPATPYLFLPTPLFLSFLLVPSSFFLADSPQFKTAVLIPHQLDLYLGLESQF